MENENNIEAKPAGDNENIKEVNPVSDNESRGKSELFLMLSEYLNKIIKNPFLRQLVRSTIISVIVILLILFIFSFYLYIVPGMQDLSFTGKLKTTNPSELKNEKQYKSQITVLNRDVQRITRKFYSYTPGQSYLVINTTDNRFLLYRNKKLVREGFCSSGSYTHLTSAEGTRHWIFKTPKGKFWIEQKITKPLWKRPDWSFVEEGLPIPPPDDQSRYEFGVLGDYAMSLGDGYLIHGTIYKRFLGMPVTHGCVRLNDEDLEAIFNTLNLGSKVYIF
ncbi:MAG: L,D-transpeptidase [Bacteroidales bacterium]|jgi:hypothetical protein